MGGRVRMTLGAVTIVVDLRHGSRKQACNVTAQKVIQRAAMTVLTVNQVVFSGKPVSTWAGIGLWMSCRRVCCINMALGRVVKTARASRPTLQRGTVAIVSSTTGPAIVVREPLVILLNIIPPKRMGPERRARKVTIVATERITAAIKIDTMTSLAAS